MNRVQALCKGRCRVHHTTRTPKHDAAAVQRNCGQLALFHSLTPTRLVVTFLDSLILAILLLKAARIRITQAKSVSARFKNFFGQSGSKADMATLQVPIRGKAGASQTTKAVILAGGPSRGTRFRPLSLDLPKVN